MKITTPGYFLPTIEALVPGTILSSGRTQPQVITGVCTTTHRKGDYVVKYSGASSMSVESCARELLASFIALELGLNIPEPVVVNISNSFSGANAGASNDAIVRSSIGINFGSRYITGGYQALVRGQKIAGPLNSELVKIFAFDLLISNADRRVEKNNFTVDGRNVLIFDHEAAFGYVLTLSFAKNPTPWIIRSQEMTWIAENLCYTLLKGKNFEFDTFVDTFSQLDSNFWQQAWNLMPNGWQNPQFSEIRSYTEAVINNKNTFAQELKRILQ